VVWFYCHANFVFDSWTTSKLSTCAMIVMVGNGTLVWTFPVVVCFSRIARDLPRPIARALREAAFRHSNGSKVRKLV
jgi:hypothetical protein